MPSPLRVALDGRPLQTRPVGGVGRMIAELSAEMAEEVQFTLLTNAGRAHPAQSGLPQVSVRGPVGHRALPWMQLSVPRWLSGFDGIFHGTFNTLPFRHVVPSVVTIHDLSFETHPWLFPSAAARHSMRLQAKAAARRAEAVLTISQFTQSEMERVWGIDPQRVVLAPPSVGPGFTPEGDEGDLRRLLASLQIGQRYIVALGGAARRRLPVAVQAWRRVKNLGQKVELVVVGAGKVPADVTQLEHCNDGTLQCLLRGAEAFVYPTEYEGFGMPALEAAASGTPVVCARTSALPEVLGPAAEWCEAPTAQAISKGLDRVLRDGAHAAALSLLGRERAATAPTWAQSARAVRRAYERAAGGG